MQKYEVKVLGNDKRVYKVADFVTAGKTYMDAIGIVFGTPLIGLRVLTFDCSVEQWSDTDIIENIPYNESQAIQTLCGLEDTRRIVESQANSEGMTAAKWCWRYQKGDCQWYLPSVMELGALFLVRDEVNDAMKKLGCNNSYLLPTNNPEDIHAENLCRIFVWSSSEYSPGYGWRVNLRGGDISYGGKYNNYVVRAIANPFSNATKIGDSKMSDEEIITILRSRGYSGELKLTKTLVV